MNGCYFTPNYPVQRLISQLYQMPGMMECLFFKFQVLQQELFSAQEAKCSSTVRELLALQNIYCSELGDRFMGSTVYHYTDNMAVPTIVQVGSKKPHLQDIAVNIFEACKKKEIELIVEWRSREHPLLQHADLGSKSFDLAAFSLDFQSFLVILEYFNFSIQVDCMSNFWNRKAEIFFSKTQELRSADVNFFFQAYRLLAVSAGSLPSFWDKFGS